MPEMLDAALAYARRGWPIFPCKLDKSPMTTNGVLDATTDIDQIERWWTANPDANIGLDVGGANMMVLDLDPGHDMKELEKNVGPIPFTALRAKTPRGGEHIFLSIAEGEIVAASTSKIAPHVDVRSFHSYVLLAPSKTDAGKYIWNSDPRNDERLHPAYRTDEIIRICNIARQKSEDANNWIIEPDLKENVEAAIRWLEKDAKPSIKGQAGDHCALATAAMMKSYGLSEETALEAMLDHWNDRNTPSWEYEKLEIKVRNAYRYNSSPPGNMTAVYHEAKTRELFKPVLRDTDEAPINDDAPGREYTQGRFRVVDFEGMARINPPSWIIKDLLPTDSYVLLYGAKDAYKTFLALDMALSIASGVTATHPWNSGHDLFETGPVLFAAGEGREGIKQRAYIWRDVYNDGDNIDDFYLADPTPNIHESDDSMADFLNITERMSPTGYKLIIVDTVSRAMAGSNENAQENVSAMTDLARNLATKFGCTVIGIHHTGKDQDSPRGGSGFEADADVVIKAETKMLLNVTLSVEKMKNSAKPTDRIVILQEHEINNLKSLIVMPPDTKPVEPVEQPKPAVTQKQTNQKMTDDFLAEVLLRVLKRIPSKSWTNADLADAIASEDDVEIGEDHILKRLKPLRHDKSRSIRFCHSLSRSKKAGQWMYSE